MGRKKKTAREAPGGGRTSSAPSSPPPEALPPLDGTPARSIWNRKWLMAGILCAVLLAAGALRMVHLGTSPPGTLDDECVEIWNAYCMLKTGQDSSGVHWPILSTRGQGDNRPTIFMYCLMPFLAVLGPGVWSARFATACMGTLEVLLIYVAASRMFGRRAGLAAAVAMALCPWHLRNSRYAFMANSFFLTLPLAMLLLANLPLAGGAKGRPRPVLAFVAGVVTGMCCYGYPSIRMFLPLFLLAAVAVNWRGWWELFCARSEEPVPAPAGAVPRSEGVPPLRREGILPSHPAPDAGETPAIRKGGTPSLRRPGVVAVAAVLAGLALTLGPLAWAHVAHPERMGKRASSIMAWDKKDSLGTKAGKVAARYPIHFSPDFLFIQGDGEEGRSAVRRVPGTGAFQWYLLPPMLGGLVLAAWRVRRSRPARVLLAGVLLWPVADLFFQAQFQWSFAAPKETESFLGFLRVQYVHLYRSLPGLPILILLAAYGAGEGGLWLWRHGRTGFGIAAAGLTAWAILWSAGFFQRFYVDYNTQPKYYQSFECSMVDALQWLKPKFAQADAVFLSMGVPEPGFIEEKTPDGRAVYRVDPLDTFEIRAIYLIALVELGYDPREWFQSPPRIHRDVIYGDTDWVSDFGKVHLGYNGALAGSWRDPNDPDAASRMPALIQGLPSWKQLAGNGRPDKVYAVVQPDYPGVRPEEVVYHVRRPDGKVVLWIWELRL